MKTLPIIRRILTLALLTLAACSQSTDPGVDETIPPLLYLPPEEELFVDYGEELRFEVRTTDGKPYTVEFQIPPDTSATAAVLEWRVRRSGQINVIATARAGSNSRTRSWTVHAGVLTVPTWGPVRSWDLHRTDQEGTLRLSWLAPEGEDGLPPLVRYEIASSMQPISPSGFEELAKREIEHLDGVNNYETVFEELTPGVVHYFRIRVVDELGRYGVLSEERSEIPAAYISVSGQVMVLDEDYDHPMPLSGVRLLAQSVESFSGADGRYTLEALLDHPPITLELDASAQVPAVYSLTRQLDPTHDVLHDYLLFPRRTVTMQLPETAEWEFLLLLRTLSNKLGQAGQVAHWESYPVEIHVPEKTLPNGVDYALAVRRGIQKWNDAVGFPVLHESAEPPALGVETSYDLPLEGGGTLGYVSLLEPAGGSLYNTVPRKLRYALVEWFIDQALADRVALHELGHVLYLTHSPSVAHLMSAGISGSSPNEVHPDEAAVLRTLIHTPNGTVYSWFAAAP